MSDDPSWPMADYFCKNWRERSSGFANRLRHRRDRQQTRLLSTQSSQSGDTSEPLPALSVKCHAANPKHGFDAAPALCLLVHADEVIEQQS
jgi:hypothetical protein